MKHTFTSELKVRTIRDDMTAKELELFLGSTREWGDADDAACRGALYLDRVMPGWYDRVSIMELQLDSTCSCVLGQLFNDDYKAIGLLTRFFNSDRADDVPVVFANVTQLVNASLNGFGVGVAVLNMGPTNNFPELDSDPRWSRDPVVFFGFDHSVMYGYSELTEAWTEEISDRRVDPS